MKNNKRNNISMSLSTLLVLLLFISLIIVFFTSIIPYLLSLIKSGNDARINAILSIISNVSGGLIAGLVAYITAKYQVKKIEDQNKTKEIKISLTEIKFIRQELIYNLRVFENISHEDDHPNKENYLSTQLKAKIWNNTNLNFVNHIGDKLLESLFNYYNLINYIIDNQTAKNIEDLERLNKKLIEKINIKLDELNDNGV